MLLFSHVPVNPSPLPARSVYANVHTDADTHARTLTRLEQELQGTNSL